MSWQLYGRKILGVSMTVHLPIFLLTTLSKHDKPKYCLRKSGNFIFVNPNDYPTETGGWDSAEKTHCPLIKTDSMDKSA